MGLVRIIVGLTATGAPVLSARVVGSDSATARRVTWLTRMMAGRELAVGLGALTASRRGTDAAPWLLFGAVADGVDAAAFILALRQRRIAGPLAWLVATTGPALTAAGVVQAVRLRRRG
jgi:hypothetical protein